MDVIVDNCTVPLEGAPTDTLAVVNAVSAHLKKQGRALLTLKVDGREISAANLNALGHECVPENASIEATSEPVSALADRALGEIQSLLPELPAACHALAAVFQGNTPTEGFEPFQQLASIWWEVKARELEVARALDCPLEEVGIEGMSVLRMHEDLNRYLEEAAEALEANDCVLLGDLLEYELAPRARQEAEIVAVLLQRASQQSA